MRVTRTTSATEEGARTGTCAAAKSTSQRL
jgi:hypothetical protein